MTDFYDPITKTELSYHIDPRLKVKWDQLRGGKLQKKDEDRVYIVDGRERMGKSTFAFQQAKYIDPTFNVDRVCFTPKQFLEQIRNAPEGSSVVFDEAFRGLSSKASQSRTNKEIVEALMEVGQRNLVIFILLPTFFLLEIYAAVLRSNVLFHVYKNKNGLRCWRLYNERQKSLLWKVGKKKGFDYSFPKVRIRGRFYSKMPIDQQKYLKKKMETFRGVEEVESEVVFDKKLIYLIKNELKLSDQKVSMLCKRYGRKISSAYVGIINRELRESSTTTN